MKCFGQNKYGQGNVPEMWPNDRPTDCPGNEKGFCFDYDDGWRNVSAGWLHTCAIQASGDLYCWGNNRQGEMGGDVAGLVDGAVTCSNDRGDKKDTCQSKLKGKFALVGGYCFPDAWLEVHHVCHASQLPRCPDGCDSPRRIRWCFFRKVPLLRHPLQQDPSEVIY